MAAVNVGIGHNNDLVVAQLRYVEITRSDSSSKRRDKNPDLFKREHLIKARLLNV